MHVCMSVKLYYICMYIIIRVYAMRICTSMYVFIIMHVCMHVCVFKIITMHIITL